MALTVADYYQLKTEIERHRRQAAQVEGVLQKTLEQLKAKHNCSNVKEAEELLKRLTKQRDLLDKQLETEAVKFKEKWGSKL